VGQEWQYNHYCGVHASYAGAKHSADGGIMNWCSDEPTAEWVKVNECLDVA